MESLQHSSSGRYEILEQIGRGSMGAVYLAIDSSSGQQVALKTLNDAGSLADEDLERLRRLFLNEASTGSQLAHPGIVRILDLVDEPGEPEIYLVLEYVSGSSLADLLARPDPIPFSFIANVIGSVADALDHVHTQGIVHRDIKPANILIGADGEVKLGDFGIAELRDEDLAAELRRAGSPNYMAPERVLGTGSDHRGDIWALGVVLYEMLTRRLPFQGESVAELVTNIAAEAPAPLECQGAPALPGLQPIVDRALAKEPEERYQFAGEMAEELRAVEKGQLNLSATLPAASIPEIAPAPKAPEPEPEPELASEPPAATQEPPKRFHRLPSRRLLTATALALFGVAAVWLGIGAKDDDLALEAATAASERTTERRFEYLTLLEQARALLEQGDSETAAQLFARAEPLSPDARRIRALRDAARRQAELEIAAEVDLEVGFLVGLAEVDLDEGRLDKAAQEVERALELDPEHGAALTLEVAVSRARQARAANARSRSRRAEAAPVVVAPAPVRPEPIRVVQPIQPPVERASARHSDLKIDFYSELPRGVVTVYRGSSQVLRRPFRFVEKKGFLRSRGVSGGFDEQVRVPAGPSELRVYLSLPGRETQVKRLSGILPAGAIRALRLRVNAAGEMSVELH